MWCNGLYSEDWQSSLASQQCNVLTLHYSPSTLFSLPSTLLDHELRVEKKICRMHFWRAFSLIWYCALRLMTAKDTGEKKDQYLEWSWFLYLTSWKMIAVSCCQRMPFSFTRLIYQPMSIYPVSVLGYGKLITNLWTIDLGKTLPHWLQSRALQSLSMSIEFHRRLGWVHPSRFNLQGYFYPSNWQIKWHWSAHLVLRAEGKRE